MDDDDYPELLSNMAGHVAELLQKHGIPTESAVHIAFEAAEHVRMKFSGHMLYWPKGMKYQINQRDAKLIGEWTGNNISELATKYNLTEVRIYFIVRRYLLAERERRQPDLFGGKSALAADIDPNIKGL